MTSLPLGKRLTYGGMLFSPFTMALRTEQLPLARTPSLIGSMIVRHLSATSCAAKGQASKLNGLRPSPPSRRNEDNQQQNQKFTRFSPQILPILVLSSVQAYVCLGRVLLDVLDSLSSRVRIASTSRSRSACTCRKSSRHPRKRHVCPCRHPRDGADNWSKATPARSFVQVRS